MKTTLNKIKAHNPCKEGWDKLLKYLNKTKADDKPLSIATIIESNGLDHALWCLRAVDGYEKEKRLFAVFCLRQVGHFLKTKRVIKAINVAEKYANGEATQEELDKFHKKVASDSKYFVNRRTKSFYAAFVLYCATSMHRVGQAAYFVYAAHTFDSDLDGNSAFVAREIASGDVAFLHPSLNGIKKEQAEELKRLCALEEK